MLGSIREWWGGGKREKIEARIGSREERGRRDERREQKDKGHKQRYHNQRMLL